MKRKRWQVAGSQVASSPGRWTLLADCELARSLAVYSQVESSPDHWIAHLRPVRSEGG
ncbi:UNVERIFIED_CONTAM: hypothetical protein Sradi_3839700 [Sesamum radiatum]|uniref:Uncharacterized protein n=1 Tax=Sesamum radiatum TaxID=300843 RepID=A0AAW2Q1F0_SESRA